MAFERWISVTPAYDCINKRPCHFGKDTCIPGTGGSHGRHSAEIAFYVAEQGNRANGVVQFIAATGWMLDETPERAWGLPMAFDLGYHSPIPRYEGHEPLTDTCKYIDGKCYYDGSGLNADTPWMILRHHGSEHVWIYLEDYWRGIFGDGPKYVQGMGELIRQVFSD